jgi:hypothetical protein
MAKPLPSPEELRRKVTSPGGTTEAAFNILNHNGVKQSIIDAVLAAAQELAPDGIPRRAADVLDLAADDCACVLAVKAGGVAQLVGGDAEKVERTARAGHRDHVSVSCHLFILLR